MKLISLGTIDVKFLIPIFGGIFSLIYSIFRKYSPKNEIINQNPFLISIYTSLGMIMAFVPFLIIKLKSKRANKIYKEQLIKSKIYNKLIVNKNAIEMTRWKKYRFIFYSGIFDFLQSLFTTLFTQYFVYNLWIFDIMIMSLFSYLFLKAKYYKHQFISMIVIVILGFVLNIIAYFKLYDSEENGLNLFDIFIKFITEICFCLDMIIIKYNMEKNYCNPYELCLDRKSVV